MGTVHLTDYNEAERADYMVVVAAMAHTHGEATSEDIMAMRELCLRHVLGPEARGRVMAAYSTPPDNLEAIIRHLSHTRLRHSLLLDVCMMAHHHGVTPAEEAGLKHVAGLLGASSAEVQAVEKLARLLGPAAKSPSQDDVDRAVQAVEAAGVPHGALAVSATMLGLDPAAHPQVRQALKAR